MRKPPKKAPAPKSRPDKKSRFAAKAKVKKEDDEIKLTPEDDRRAIHWFPGHMAKATKKIKENVRLVDIVLEIRDARSPLVTSNPSLTNEFKDKSRLIVLNKANLADPKVVVLWQQWFEKKGEPFIFVNGLEPKSLVQVLDLARDIIERKRLANNPESRPKTKLRMMMIGLPNTGKSTIINRFSNRDATKVADKPGQTQSHIWISVNKDFELLDTPGIMTPVIKNREHGLWLAVLHALPERIVDSEDTACFIVEHLLKNNPDVLVSQYKLENSPADLSSALEMIAQKRGCLLKQNEYDFDRVFKLIIADCRSSLLGPISFGLPPK